jgi:hypothetical protein
MPTNNDTVVCPGELNSCYFWYPQSNVTSTAATSKCAAVGGSLAQWNSPYEQRSIESYFQVGVLHII